MITDVIKMQKCNENDNFPEKSLKRGRYNICLGPNGRYIL